MNRTRYKRNPSKSRIPNSKTLLAITAVRYSGVMFCYELMMISETCKVRILKQIALLTKNNILDFSTTAGVPGGAIGGALGGIVKQNCTFHFS